MSTPCEKHASLPVVGQSPCAGCEIERLMAENAGLHAQVDTLAERHASALCEIEALRKDAARYRWTSIEGNWVARMFGKWRAHVGEYGVGQPTDWYGSREEAIDAAMSKDPLANPGQ